MTDRIERVSMPSATWRSCGTRPGGRSVRTEVRSADVSASLAALLYALGAHEVAVIELSVGAGLVTVLFVFAINIAGEEPIEIKALVSRMALELASSGLDFMLLNYGADTDKAPSGTDAPADRHSVSFFSANRSLELNLNYASLPGAGYDTNRCGCAHIEHKRLAGVNGLHAGLICNTYHPIQ